MPPPPLPASGPAPDPAPVDSAGDERDAGEARADCDARVAGILVEETEFSAAGVAAFSVIVRTDGASEEVGGLDVYTAEICTVEGYM